MASPAPAFSSNVDRRSSDRRLIFAAALLRGLASGAISVLAAVYLAKRGFKVIQVYRTDCTASPRVELRIAAQDGMARCTYGGKLETAKLDPSADYVMHAQTARWQEMGRGEYGPMRAMMFGRLKFDGPMFEAMDNMGPFESFLLLVGKVKASAAACPAG